MPDPALVARILLLRPAVKAYLLRRGLELDDAEDVTQEVLLLATTRADQLDDPGHADRWVYGITRNRMHRVRGRLNRQTEHEQSLDCVTDEDEGEIRSWLADDTPGPEELAMSADRLSMVLEGIQSLPPHDREVLMAVVDGVTDRELAARDGYTIMAVRLRRYRARRRLASLLDSDADAESPTT